MDKELQLSEAVIAQKIYEIRGKKVMMSGDLADLYEVETKALNQQVKRNLGRFPERYMFKLTTEEYQEALRSQNVTLKRGQHSLMTEVCLWTKKTKSSSMHLHRCNMHV